MRINHIIILLLASAFSLFISSCGDDNSNEPYKEDQDISDDKDKEEYVSKIDDVFPGKKISSFYEYAFSYNDDGTLASAFKTSNDNYSYEYDGENVVMRAYRPQYSATYTFHIGRNGFADKCISELSSGYHSTITFTYDSGGHLIKYEEPENSNYCMDFYIEDDNVAKVESRGHTGKSSWILTYGKDLSHGLMILNVFFDLDSFDMNFAYFAGLLGISSKTLPISAVASWYDERITYSWEFDNEGYPTNQTCNPFHPESVKITWE